jgi:zinc transport system permease protein
MAVWYQLIDVLLPFEWVTHGFMKNALLGVLLVTPIFGLLGTMIVSNRMAFFSDAIGHSALTGIALGVILGMGDPLWSMLAFSIALAIGITAVKNANSASTDTIIGVFSSTAVALGIAILSMRGGFSKYAVYLIGDLLSVSATDLLLLAVVLVVVLGFWTTIFNGLLLVSVNRPLASSRGVNVLLYEYLFAVLTSIVVAISIQWVGILVISSLLVLPAAAARNVAGNMQQYHAYSVLIAVASGLSGLILSYYLGTATGATIVLVAAACFAATLVLRRQG